MDVLNLPEKMSANTCRSVTNSNISTALATKMEFVDPGCMLQVSSGSPVLGLTG